MAIPFLNNIDISDNQLLNAKFQVTFTAPSAEQGQVYFNTTTDYLKTRVYDGTSWLDLLDTTSIVDGTYITSTVTNNVDLTLDLSATGTASATTFLRGDNVWAEVDNQTITLTGDITGSGTSSIATTISAGAVDFDMLNQTDIITVSEGIGNNDNDISIPTSGAVKSYVDSSVAGQLVYQGGYNAATNVPNLDNTPSITIKRGFTYTVTHDGLFFTEQVRVGDLIISEVDGPTALADWTTVQNNIDLADISTVGIGNVNAGTGINVAYSSGTATVSQATSTYSETITDTDTISHGLNTSDLIIQLYDVTTGETVFADIDRISNTQVTIAFASTPTNSIRVLAQKIG